MEEPSLEKLLDSAHQELAQFDPHRLHECIRKTNYRPSFMIIPSSEIPETFRQICHSLRSVGPSLKFLIDSPSSVEGSEEDTCVPSVRKVAETILDIALVSFSVSLI